MHFDDFFNNLADHYNQAVLAAIGTVLLLITLFILKRFCNIRRKVNEVREFVGVGTGRPRFRKRDKVMFYGRKMLRKVKSISTTSDRLKTKKRQMVIKFAKKLLRLRKENQPQQLQVKEPPLAYLEPDLHESSEHSLPPEVQYMLRCIRIFGHFDKPMFLELYKHLESRFLYAGQYLFRIGEQDDSIYVVQSGKLNISLIEPDGSELSLKTVAEGDSLSSFLSFIDVLVGQPSYFKTVSARAEVDTIVLRLPLSAFADLFSRYPEYLVRVIQIIMVRLHRVSFTALYQYLGLTSQLVNPSTPYRRTISATNQSVSTTSPKPSPSRSKEHVRSLSATTHDRLPIYEQFGEDGMEYCEPVTVPYSTSLPTDSDASLTGSLGVNRVGSNISLSGWTKVASKSSISSKLSGTQEPVRKKRRSLTIDSKNDPNSLHFGHPGSIDDIDYMRLAIDGIKANLCLDDEELLNGRLEIRDVTAGTYLIRQESLQDTALIYTLTGCLLVSQKLIDKNQEVTLYFCNPGEVIGGLAVISGEPSYFTVRARQPSRVAIISKVNFYSIMRERPRIVLHASTSIIRRLSPFVRQIDFALDWKHIESGKALYGQNDTSDCMYIVLSGRLRSVITHANGKKELVGEYGKGDLVGIVELLTLTKRSTSVIAVRDTELAIMPEGLLNTIKIKFPTVVTRLVHLLSHRILGSWQRGSLVASRPSASNFSTVAILAVNDDVPLSSFTMELHHSISGIGGSMRLTSDLIRKMQGISALERSNEIRLSSWLGQQEDHHRVVLYQCDGALTPWTLRCIRQADVILIVAMADQQPTVGKIEKQLESLAIRTQKELILLHKEGAPRPRRTVAWLNMRTWCSSHHHISCPTRMFAQKSATRMAEMYSRIGLSEPNIHSDFSRLARFLTGTSIGLVLGGGGARGCAHVGMIRAIIEAGIPIDMVGGTSIGAFMGALWCMEKDLTTFTQKAREFAIKMTSVWRMVYDLTYPVTALFTGAGFNRTITDVFRDTQIEDLWLPYFAVTTDITDSRQRVHTHGSLWRFVRGSMSLSGFMPPLCMTCESMSCDSESLESSCGTCKHTHLLLDGGYVNNLPGSLWRTIRASMSICGVLPPVCISCESSECESVACLLLGLGDDHCHLHVDGAYVNNLPADVMRSLGASYILAIDVGSQDDCDHTNYGDQLSGWWLLWKRYNPWAKPIKVPNLAEIQSRLAYVSCVRQLEEVKRYDSCVYIRPPIDKYRTLQFGSFDEIRDVGLNYGKIFFEDMARDGLLPGRPAVVPEKLKVSSDVIQQNYVSETTFTDLAEMVCRIQEPSKMSIFSHYSDDEDVDDDTREDGYQSEPPVSHENPDDKDPDYTSSYLRRRNTSGSLTELFEA